MDSPPKRSSIPISTRKASLQIHFSEDKSADSDSSVTSPSISMYSSLMSPQIASHFSSNEYSKLKESHSQLINKYKETVDQNLKLEAKHNNLKKENSGLKHEISVFKKNEAEYKEVLEANIKLKNKLNEILPGLDDEDDDKKQSNELENLMNEMEKLKSYLNNVELQLYEANEKISELQEIKHQFEEENSNLRKENTELNNVAKLMSLNMLESLDTNKKMEESVLRVRHERDQLIRSSRVIGRDAIDSKEIANEEIHRMRNELEIQKRKYEAQFIEYKKLMEETLDKNSNEQIEVLNIRVALLEKDLESATDRAMKAEEELRELRRSFRASQLVTCVECDAKAKKLAKIKEPVVDALPRPPPPPPPLPPPFLPPPIPMVKINSNSIETLTGAISSCSLNKIDDEDKNKRTNMATGLDSVIDDIKNGRVTLRKRQRPTKTQENKNNFNPVLKEMFDIIARTKRQNRQSKVVVDCELFAKFKDNKNT